MNNKLYIVGIGPGSPDLISVKALKIIKESDILIGGKRNLSQFKVYHKTEFEVGNNLDKMILFIEEHLEESKICVLASGDPYLFGIANYITSHLKRVKIETVCGISSIQYLAAKVGIGLDKLYLTSVHGKSENLDTILNDYKYIGLFTAKEPELVLKKLLKAGFGKCTVIVGENLSYENEKITKGTIEKLSKNTFSDLTIMILENTADVYWKYCTGGITEDLFIRGNVPMTKEEIRAVSIAKLRLKPDSIVLDIGAGTGSVTVECALQIPKGQVIAFERKKEALELIRQNCSKFQLSNVTVIEGDIANTLKENCYCDRAFIGGSGGKMDSILKLLSEENPNLKVVINTITLESVMEAMEGLKKYGFEKVECVTVNISKSHMVGTKYMMMAQNPITIISGEKGEL